MLFASARASDAARAVSLWVDFSDVDGATVWIDSEVKKSKTAIGSRARLLLPLLAPCVVFRLEWVNTWLEAREHLHLGVHGSIDEGSLVPLFTEAGDWTGRPTSPQHLTSWLRDTLSPEFPDAQRLSSHSLKATGLTWAAPIVETFSPPRPECWRRFCLRLKRERSAQTSLGELSSGKRVVLLT